jgi:AraC-like DNA-binding protein
MIKVGPEEKVYSVAKIVALTAALEAEGFSAAEALEGAGLAADDLDSPAIRVSMSQMVRCCENALRLSADPDLAYSAGLRMHVSSYGMYGFAILSSTSFRQTMRFAEKYHQLAAPLADIAFKEEDGAGQWIISPLSHPSVHARLFRFIVELQFGVHASLHRDVMGSSFAPRELRVAFGVAGDGPAVCKVLGCPLLIGQPENRFVFDGHWLDQKPNLGAEFTYASVRDLCDQLMDELQLRVGLVGKVREHLLVNLARPTSFEAIARSLNMTTRTLSRKLKDHNASFRGLVEELKTRMAIRYLRDTELTVEEIASALGFSDSANFRQSFRRWTKRAPSDFRNRAGTDGDAQ